MEPAQKQTSALRCYYCAVSTYDAKNRTLVELLLALQANAKLALAITCSSRDSLDAVISALSPTGSFTIVALHSDLTDAEAMQQLQLMKQLSASIYGKPSAADGSQPGPSAAAAGAGTAAAGGADAAATIAASRSQQGAPPRSPALGAMQLPISTQQPAAGPAASAEAAESQSRCVVLVATDVCLKAASKDLLPLGLPLLVQYDLPGSKEVQQRRVAAIMGGSRERRGRSNSVIDFVVSGELPMFRAVEQFSTTPIQEMPVHVPDVLGL